MFFFHGLIECFGLQLAGDALGSRGTDGTQPDEDQPETPIAKPEVEQEVPRSLWYNDTEWNFSPKVKEKPYVPNLPDHYPRDVYTKLPKFTPKRTDFKGAQFSMVSAILINLIQ